LGTSELWLKFATTEVDEAAGLLERGEIDPALRLLRRVVLPLGCVTTQIEMLNQMDRGRTRRSVSCSGTGAGSTHLGSGHKGTAA